MTSRSVVVLIVGLIAVASFTPAGASISQRTDAPTSPTAPSRSATTTPVETPTETTVFPPGTSESGIDNATRLLEAHRSHLADETYSIRTNADQVSEVTDENGTFRGFEVDRITLTSDKGPDETLFTIEYESATDEDENASQSYWLTDEMNATKRVDGDGLETTMYTYLPTGREAALLDRAITNGFVEPSFVLRPYLLGVEYEHSGTVTRDDRTLHRFTSTGVNASAVAEHDLDEFPSSVERVDVTILVDERGVIRSFDASQTRSRGSETVTTGVSYEIPRIGNVTPSRPDWVTTELPHLDASLSGDGTVITINHTGGMSVSTANVLVHSPSVSASTDFTGTFEPGDTLYLYVTEDDASRVIVRQNERPEVNESFVRLGDGNVSITPWRIVTEGGERNSTTLEMEVRDEASNRSLPPSTVGSNNSSIPFQRNLLS